MCGLLGFVQNTTKVLHWQDRNSKLRSFMQQGLVVDSLRGMDATGIARVGKDNLKKPADVYKKGVAGSDFIQLKKADDLLQGLADVPIMIGHNRAGTRGGLNGDRNAHPFQVDHITLVHNGTLNSYHQLSRRNPAEVDSAYIAAALAEGEPLDVLPVLEGSYTLVWHDARDGSFNVARNKDRPIWWTQLGSEEEPWDTIAFGSEIGMVWWLLDRIGVESHGKFRTVNPMQWMKMFPDKIGDAVYTPYTQAERQVYRGPNSSFTDGGRSQPLALPKPSTGAASGTSGSTAGDGKGSPASTDKSSSATSEGGGSTTTTNGHVIKRAPMGRKEKKGDQKLGLIGLNYGALLACTPVEFVTHGKGHNKGFGTFKFEPRSLILEVNMTRDQWLECAGKRALLMCKTVRNGKAGAKIVQADFNKSLTRAVDMFGVKTVMGPHGYEVPLGHFNELVKDGCVQCHGFVNPTFANDMLWLKKGADKQPVCHVCAAQPGVRNLLQLEATRVTH
jgi:Glutamine amidotransferase domain